MRLFLLIVLLASRLSALAQTDAPAAPQQQPNGPMQDGHRARRPDVAGTVTALTDDTLTVRTFSFDQHEVTVKLTSSTHYRKDQQESKLSDLKVGDAVMIRGERTGENEFIAAAVMVRTGMGIRGGPTPEQIRELMGKKIIAGEIKTIEGMNLTIARSDGETQTITVDENTSFRKEGESITLVDLKPGDHVFGRGQLNKDGVFIPSVLNVGETGAMRMHPREAPSPEQHP